MEWIKPIDRLPKEGEEVLITVADNTRAFGSILSKGVHQAQFHDDPTFSGKYYPIFSVYDSEGTELTGEVLAWMPMPEPYDEEVTNA